MMEKPSAGSGILSRSRAKTAPNGGQPHSEDDSSEEEHSHGEPRGLGLKAHRPGGAGWAGGAGPAWGRVADHRRIILMVLVSPGLEPLPCFCPKPGAAGTGTLEAEPLAAEKAVLPAAPYSVPGDSGVPAFHTLDAAYLPTLQGNEVWPGQGLEGHLHTEL